MRRHPAWIALLGSLLVVGGVRAVAGDDRPVPLEAASPTGTVAPTTTSTTTAPSTTTTVAVSTAETMPLKLKVTSIDVRSPGGALEKLGRKARKRIVGAVEQYLRAATLRPLLAGSDVGDKAVDEQVRPLLARSIRPRLDGPDRRSLVDEGMPRAVGGVSVEKAELALIALGDGDGRLQLVTAALDTRFTAHTVDGPLLLHRRGELILVPGKGGSFAVDGYRLSVRRELGADASAEAGL